MSRIPEKVIAMVAVAAVLVGHAPVADACGCLSPPLPPPDAVDFAVNQRAEQIIFETEPGWVTAHVRIQYAGEPSSFAWIVPVPEQPELGLSPISTFGLIDRATAPQVSVVREDACPKSAWACKYHPAPDCYSGGGLGCGGGGADSPTFVDAGFAPDAGAGGMPPVTVLDEQVVGDYQTVTFRADESQAAVQWLRDNGFIVNQTTSIFMEPYIAQNMVFVAIKLVPGAGVTSIKPLKMRYRAAFPTIPLVLTAVAAEPHLTVTAFIYGASQFRPMGRELVTIDGSRIALDRSNRLNYPMVLARTIDEAGGDAFIVEYAGQTVGPPNATNPCCSASFDLCGIGSNGTCECPGSGIDADCAGGDLEEGVELLNELNSRHPFLTRITTRVSPEEMRFDPTFEPGLPSTVLQPLVVPQPTLAACRDDVLDQPSLREIDAQESCAATYCGTGECVATATGPACLCAAGTVAQRFIDVDNQPSVTCVPETPTVDLRAGGAVLPDACAGVSCGTGTCTDRNGVAVCTCASGSAAVAGAGVAPRCEPVRARTNTPGAQDYSDALETLDVCAPAYPTCGPGGWLTHVGTSRPGVACAKRDIDPPPLLTLPTDPPSCGDDGACGASPRAPAPLVSIGGSLAVLALVLRRRRRVRA